MKKIILIAACIFYFSRVGAQTEDEKWNVGIHGGFTQYRGDLGNGWYAKDQAAYGFVGGSVSRYLTKRFDASLMLTRGEAGYMTSRDYSVSDNVNFNFRIKLTTANLVLRYNLVDRESYLIPYVFAGGSAILQEGAGGHHSTRSNTLEYAVPTGGAGLTIRLGPVVAIQIQETFMYTSADDIDYHVKEYNDWYLLHSIGFTFNLEKRQMFGAGSSSKKLDRCPGMKTGLQVKNGEAKGKLKPKKNKKKFNTKDKEYF